MAEWQHYYNWDRPYGAHHGKSPMEHYFQLSDDTSYSDEIDELFLYHLTSKLPSPNTLQSLNALTAFSNILNPETISMIQDHDPLSNDVQIVCIKEIA